MKSKMSNEDLLKFFGSINKVSIKEKTLSRSGEKVTVESLLKKQNITLDLPKELEETLKPALEADLNAPAVKNQPACVACSACAACTICAAVNYSAGLVGLVGAVGFAD